jgi:hypothetical protein
VTWELVQDHGLDSEGNSIVNFIGKYGLLSFTECAPTLAILGGNPQLVSACETTFADEYVIGGADVDYNSVFLAKNYATLAFTIVAVFASLLSAYSWIEVLLVHGGRNVSAKPNGLFSAGTAIWMQALTFVSSVVALSVFSSVLADDKEHYPAASVWGGPGFALIVVTAFLSAASFIVQWRGVSAVTDHHATTTLTVRSTAAEAGPDVLSAEAASS